VGLDIAMHIVSMYKEMLMFFLLTIYNKLTPTLINVQFVNDVGPRLKMFGSLVSTEEITVTDANTMEFIHMNVHP
jgi:putative Mn2+ efflux pump MntP